MAVEDDVESCGSRAADASSAQAQPRDQRQKLEAYNEVLRRLQASSDCEDAHAPGFDDQLWLHFNRLPARYALDVNVERAEDVLMHMRLLKLAEDPDNRPAFDIRPVQVYPNVNGNRNESVDSESAMADDAQSSLNQSGRVGILLPPTFGSSSNFDGLNLQANRQNVEDGDGIVRPTHEITFSALDKRKVLSELTALLSEIGLNIQEAHAFSTVDGFSLDVFVVDGWHSEEEELRKEVEKGILKSKQEHFGPKHHSIPALGEHNQDGTECFPECVKIPTDGTDVWEIDMGQLVTGAKVASGSFGDLYRGTYCGQEVAIKILKPGRANAAILSDFAQEIYIMRKIRHKNVVQFIGACTRPPNLYIVTEFMSKGSIYDFLHKQNGAVKLPSLLKVAIDVSKGMNYLHQNNIIHRDLKTANLLMDENEVVKVADFGVARVQAETGVMTAETGTYRWMAPEVIEHRQYDHKADIFSFGIVLWELLTGELPYAYMTPLQAAIGVVQKDLRPSIPKDTDPLLVELLQSCWERDPKRRPNFSEISEILQQIAKKVGEEGEDKRKDKTSGGFFSSFKRSHN
ncbi:serine/threonine-protein kinase STY8 isoform X1 [Eucalyptus grandis]|uniref:Uncharacterized protein n=2 Tax=Eucalyptus grandis TaxID=71139 RepID=A0ACC3JJ53_EUCGR|nr:serine/threonine-protein kinase STY8 isoform X1 [Eucalyptus grandis]KAK3413730.1 hypothetical protein EUGRSUZ_I02291 [Eucalyptus grandis]